MPRGRRAGPEPATLDEVDRGLVLALSRDGRRSAAALAKELGLSRQAVTERIRDLERRRIIRGYRADVDPLALGLEVRAQLRLTLDATAPASREKDVLRRLATNPLVRSVYRVSGEDGLVMALIALFVDRESGRPTRRQLADYALIGVLLLAFGNAMVMWAEQRITSGITALIVAMVPTWLTFFDGLRPHGQPWTLRVWLGVMVGMAGVGLVARPGGGMAAGHWPAVAMLMVASIAWSIGSLYSQSVPRRLPLFSAAAVEMIAGAVVLAAESRLMREDLGRFASASPNAWWALLYLAVFGSLVGFTAFAFCL